MSATLPILEKQRSAAIVAMKSTTSLRRSGRWASLVTLAALAIAPAVLPNFAIFQLSLLLSYAVAVLALSILTGASGQFSLGQSAFFGIGAYIAAVSIEQGGVHYALTVPIAGAICFVFGSLFGRPALRLSGTYLALATFALAAATPQLFKLGVLEPWTGGVQGLVVSKPAVPFGLPISQDKWIYCFTLVVALAVYALSSNLLRSRSGRAIVAIRDNEIAASAMGVDVALYKTLVFGVSGAVTGIAGSLSAISVGFVAPDSYPIGLSIAIFLGMVVGGVGWLPGSLVGAAFIVFIPNIAESVSKGFSGAVYGVLLFVIIFALPGGAQQIAAAVERCLNRKRDASKT